MLSFIQKYKSKFFDNKYNSDLVWNIGSFVIGGIIGILLNVIIIKTYNLAVLGYFNILFALFIFLSQVSTWGLHLSVQKYTPQYSSNLNSCKRILLSALLATFMWALGISCILLILNKIPGIIFNSENLTAGFIFLIPGVFLISFNKVLAAFINGLQEMKLYAIINSLRFILMLVTSLTIIYLDFHPYFLSLVFTIPELIIFIILIIRMRKYFSYSPGKYLWLNLKMHFKFANKAALGYIVLDLNSKVDVLLLGLFVSDSLVGLYSFPAYIVDALLPVAFVFRNNLNPILTKIYFNKSKPLLEYFIKKSIRNSYKLFIIGGILLLIGYPLFLLIFSINENFLLNYSVFSILTFGFIASSGFLPLQMLFNQTGYPGVQTKFLLSYFFSNIILNLCLIPLFGILGSAIATALATLSQIVYLKVFSSKTLNIKI